MLLLKHMGWWLIFFFDVSAYLSVFQRNLQDDTRVLWFSCLLAEGSVSGAAATVVLSSTQSVSEQVFSSDLLRFCFSEAEVGSSLEVPGSLTTDLGARFGRTTGDGSCTRVQSCSESDSEVGPENSSWMSCIV